MNPTLVNVLRGAAVESTHCGALAVLDAAGAVRWQLGDIDRPIFPRSAVKVLQALPLVESGAADQLGLADEELLAFAPTATKALHPKGAQTFRSPGARHGAWTYYCKFSCNVKPWTHGGGGQIVADDEETPSRKRAGRSS